MTGPLNSPSRTSSQPLWCAWPGPFIEAPKPPTTPTITRSRPSTAALVSGPPRPFCTDSTTVSGPISALAACAARSTSRALVAITTSSQGPASAAFSVACSLTTRSPEAPSTRRPCVRMASTCAAQESMAHTSWPAAANRPA